MLVPSNLSNLVIFTTDDQNLCSVAVIALIVKGVCPDKYVLLFQVAALGWPLWGLSFTCRVWAKVIQQSLYGFGGPLQSVEQSDYQCDHPESVWWLLLFVH